MKVALYARVSTRDKNQDPEVQLMELRKYCQENGMEITREYIDHASANDFVRRTAWKQLLVDASARKFRGLLVWKLDRAFRDITVATSSVKMLRNAGIDFIVTTVPVLSVQGPAGDLMFNIYAAFAQFEKDTIIERVNAGLSRAKAKGKAFGRPRKAIDFNKVLEAHEIACSRVNRITKENQGYSETARILSEQTGLRITAGWDDRTNGHVSLHNDLAYQVANQHYQKINEAFVKKDAVFMDLVKRGYVDPGKDGKTTVFEYIPVIAKACRVLHIKREFLGRDEQKRGE